MNDSVEAAYDRLPYPSGPHPYSHPSHTGMLAKLAGCDPVQVDRCRVLEIGGSDGGNLLPIAIDFPESEFVCLDISSVQIEMYSQLLSPRGIGFISYNTFPGWHAHLALREMMQMHVDGIENDSERVEAVLDLVNQIAAATKDTNTHLEQMAGHGLLVR